MGGGTCREEGIKRDTLHVQSWNREMNVTLVLNFLLISFQDSQCIGQCHPHSGWAIPSQFSNLKTPSHIYLEICLQVKLMVSICYHMTDIVSAQQQVMEMVVTYHWNAGEFPVNSSFPVSLIVAYQVSYKHSLINSGTIELLSWYNL